MPDWTEALEEAYATAPADEYVVATLEIIHAAFVTAGSPEEPDSIRIALDDRPFELMLEAGAPLRGGQTVLFEPLAMRVIMPEQEEGRFGSARIALDNVPMDYLEHLELAATIRSPARMIYREWITIKSGSPAEYVSSGPPDFIMGELTVKIVEATLLSIEAEAMFLDLLNQSFPRRRFTREAFPALFGGNID